jgi:hypothetical protein
MVERRERDDQSITSIREVGGRRRIELDYGDEADDGMELWIGPAAAATLNATCGAGAVTKNRCWLQLLYCTGTVLYCTVLLPRSRP